MPIRGKTRHDPPVEKTKPATGLFVNHGETGKRPNRETLKYAKTVSSMQKGVGGKRTLSR